MSPLDQSTPLAILQGESLARAGFSHGFTTRQGGVSRAPYDSLDFALLRDPETLAENQRRLARAIGFDVDRLHQAVQVHGATVLVAGDDPKRTVALEADALVAEAGTGRAVGVRVADCVPVLVADPESGCVAAIHAGWRGVELRVIAAGVARLGAALRGDALVHRSPSRSLIAAIGPCIGPCCFEVGVDVAQRIAAATAAEVIDRTAPNGKAFVDLRLAVRTQLRSLGLRDEAIDDVPGRGREGCTRCDAARFYSYRRDADASGRLIGVIVAR